MTKREHFDTVVTKYLANVKANGCTKDTYEAYERVLRYFRKQIPEGGEDGDIEITPNIIVAWKQNISERGVKPSTTNYYMNILRVFFEWANDPAIKLYNTCPVTKGVIPKLRKARTPLYSKLLDEREYMEMFTPDKPNRYGLSKRKWYRNRAILLLLLTSGMRNIELRNLTLADLDYEHGCISVYGKGGIYRFVPFDPIAQTAVKTYLAKSRHRPAELHGTEPLFGTLKGDGKWKPFTRQGISKIISTTVRDLCGKENMASHAMRHNAASFWLLANVSKSDIQAALGHSSIVTTEKYAERIREFQSVQNINNLMRVREYRTEQDAALFDREIGTAE